MSNANRLLAAYLTACSLLVGYVTNSCAATDDQSDEGSAVLYVSGVHNRVFPADSVALGTYRTKATTEFQKTNCRWRVYHVRDGVWRQTSPRKLGDWNTLGADHRGKVRLKDQVLFQPRDCPRWEMRK